MRWYTLKGQEIRVRVRVHPGASRFGVTAHPDGRLKLHLAAPPVDGLANKQAAACLARLFAVSKKQVTLFAGAKSRDKTFTVSGITDSAILPDPHTLPRVAHKL